MNQPPPPNFRPLNNTIQKATTNNSFQPVIKPVFQTITQNPKQQPPISTQQNNQYQIEQLNLVVRSANERKQQIQEFYNNNKQ